jgi:Flp pilus assembly protein CpaB
MRRRRMYLSVGVVIVIVAAGLIGYLAYTSREAQRTPVLTVSTRIEQGIIVTAEMLTPMDVPAPGKGDPFPYFTKKSQIVGRTALVTLLPNVPISQDAIGDPAPPGRLLPSGQVIPPGQVGFAIPTSALRSVGGALKVGDTVSILIPNPEAAVPEEVESTQTISYTTLLIGVPVVDLRNEAGASLITGEAKGTASFAVLALKPEEAEEIAQYSSVLKLALEARP